MLDLLVLTVVLALFGACAACGFSGLGSILSDYGNPTFENLMVGLCATTFSAAILLCCLYTRLPFEHGEGYVVPLGFGIVGIGFLTAAAVRYISERRQTSDMA